MVVVLYPPVSQLHCIIVKWLDTTPRQPMLYTFFGSENQVLWMNAFGFYIRIFWEFSICSHTPTESLTLSTWHKRHTVKCAVYSHQQIPCNSCCVCVEMCTKIKMLIQQYVLLIIFAVNDFMLPHCDIHSLFLSLSLSAFNFPTVIALIEEWFRGKRWIFVLANGKLPTENDTWTAWINSPYTFMLFVNMISLFGCCYFSHFKRLQAILFIPFYMLITSTANPWLSRQEIVLCTKKHTCQ